MDLNQILNTRRLSEMRAVFDQFSMSPKEQRIFEKAISQIEAHWSRSRQQKVDDLVATRNQNHAAVVETAKIGRAEAKDMIEKLSSGRMSAQDAIAKLRDAHGAFKRSVEQYEAIRSNEADLEEWQSKSIDEYQEAQFQRWPHLMERAPTFGNVLNEVVGNVPNATGSPTSQGAYSFQERQS